MSPIGDAAGAGVPRGFGLRRLDAALAFSAGGTVQMQRNSPDLRGTACVAVLENCAAGKRQRAAERAFHHAKEKRRRAAAVQRLAPCPGSGVLAAAHESPIASYHSSHLSEII